jgi:hypothetical protein
MRFIKMNKFMPIELSSLDNVNAHLNVMHQFKAMYEGLHFESHLFDYDGYLQTDLSTKDKMPLEFFVEYHSTRHFLGS